MFKHTAVLLVLFAVMCGPISDVFLYAQDKAAVDVAPVPKKQVQATYPEDAKKAGIEGVVYVQANVDEKGNVTKASVTKSDAPALNNAALEAVRKWTFTPAMKDKKPVATTVTIPFKFKLQKDKN